MSNLSAPACNALTITSTRVSLRGMTNAQNGNTAPQALPLDGSLYVLDDDTSVFMKAQTGIEDAEELKKHLLRVQAEAYAVRS